MVSALVGVSTARAAALKAAGQDIPKPMSVRGLIDTGASGTCIDPSVLTALGLTPTGVVSVCTPSTGTTSIQKEQFDVAIMVPPAVQTHAPLIIHNIPVLAAELLQAQGFHALIGRDILGGCLLTYDGLNGFFSLAY